MTKWYLYGNDEFIESFTSHTKANKARALKIEESVKNGLHIHYEVKKVKEKVVKEIPMWKQNGFKSLHEYNEWLNDIYDEIHMGLW